MRLVSEVEGIFLQIIFRNFSPSKISKNHYFFKNNPED